MDQRVAETEEVGAAKARRPPPAGPRQALLPRRNLQGLWSHRWFAPALVALTAIGIWQVARILVGPAVVVDVVTHGDLVQKVVASGHVETPYRVEIGSARTSSWPTSRPEISTAFRRRASSN